MKILNDSKIKYVSNGDFQTKMASANFVIPPREEVTVEDMERYYNKAVFEGREEAIYG